MLAQDAVDRRGRKTETFEMARGTRICHRGSSFDEPLEGLRAARAFRFIECSDGFSRRIRIDPFANELADEPAVPERLAFALDVKPSVETIVEESFAFAALDRMANVRRIKTFAFEMLPEARLGAPLPR
jgi:hypothetical protein